MNVLTKSGQTLSLDLSKEIARGGEGKIIDMGNEVAKIYLPGIKSITELKFNDLSELQSNIFIKPEQLLYDLKKNIVGFTMKKVSADHFPILSLFNKTFCIREGITDKVKLNIAEKLVDAVKYAHSKSILIGDFNPYNILVNKQGSLYLIDVDSYGTKNVPHSGILFDEIRDYLYGGSINTQSDYFALSVIIFNLYTFVHPFKGIHKRVPKMSDRMLKKLPVFKADPDLFVPKCYLPITNPFQQQQFVDLYEQGLRFILDPSTISTLQVPKTITAVLTQHLNMNKIIDASIIRTTCGGDKLAVTMQDKTDIYFVGTKGICTPKLTIKTKSDVRFFLVDGYTYCLQENILYYILPFGFTQVHSFVGEEYIKVQQFGSHLIVITKSMRYDFSLTDIFEGKVRVDKSSIFGDKFVNINGLFARVDGSTMLYYNKNNVINTVVLEKTVKDIIQIGNTGIIQCLDKDTISYKYFSINNLHIELFDCGLDGLRQYDMLNSDLLVIPQDDELLLVQAANMNTLIKYDCNIVSSDSVIHCAKAGIIVVNPDGVYLANKK